jgi:hypothetical protein
MKVQLFIKNNLAIHFYYSDNSVRNGKVIIDNLYLIFPGLPQLIEKDFFKDKVSKKAAFMSVYYYGSYYSGGSFSFSDCQKSVKDAMNFAVSRKGIKTYDNKSVEWSYKSICIIGNSFGASPILTSNLNKNDVKKVILFSPLIFVYRNDLIGILSKKEAVELKKFNNNFLGFMKRGYKNIYRGIEKDEWRKYFDGDMASSRVHLRNSFPPITIFHGEEDDVVRSKNSIFFRDTFRRNVKLNLVNGVGHDFKTLFRIS